MDFGAATLEEHFVHHVIDEIDAAPVILIEMLGLSWIWELAGFEAGAGIADYDQDAAIILEDHGALHEFCGVSGAAVLDGVGESFTQSGLDFQLFRLGLPAYDGHYGFHQRRNGFNARRNGYVHLDCRGFHCSPGMALGSGYWAGLS